MKGDKIQFFPGPLNFAKKEIYCLSSAKTCPTNKFDCNGDGKECIRKSWVCDGEKDCSSGNDEKNCGAATTPKPAGTERVN